MNIFFEKGLSFADSLDGLEVASSSEIPLEGYPCLYIQKNSLLSLDKIETILSISSKLSKSTRFVKYSANIDSPNLFFPSSALEIKFEKLSNAQFFDGYQDLEVVYYQSKAEVLDYYPVHMGNYSAKALFLDRDGIINEDTGYLFETNKLILNPEILNLLKYFKAKGFLIIVLTNQSGIARGFYNEADVKKLHLHMNTLLEQLIDDWFICPFHKEGEVSGYCKESLLRKPRPGMALLAGYLHNIDFSKSLMVGDKATDHLNKIGLKTVIKKESDSFKELSSRIIKTAEIP